MQREREREREREFLLFALEDCVDKACCTFKEKREQFSAKRICGGLAILPTGSQ